MVQQTEIRLEVVQDVWQEYLQEFHSGMALSDQILILGDNLYLRGPNLDLVTQHEAKAVLIH